MCLLRLSSLIFATLQTDLTFFPLTSFYQVPFRLSFCGLPVKLMQVTEAVKIAKEKRPDLKLEGPMQYDAAVDPAVARQKVKGYSEVAGRATVCIFPDLNTGNNTYKVPFLEAPVQNQFSRLVSNAHGIHVTLTKHSPFDVSELSCSKGRIHTHQLCCQVWCSIVISQYHW